MLPLCSSRQVVNALKRLGFAPCRARGSSHQSFKRVLATGETCVTVVTLGMKEIPRGTLKSILAMGHIGEEEFLEHLK